MSYRRRIPFDIFIQQHSLGRGAMYHPLIFRKSPKATFKRVIGQRPSFST